MTPEEKQDLVDAITTVLDQRRSIPEDRHHQHHDFIERYIQKEKRKEELRQYARKQAVGWGVVALLSAAGLGMYNWFEAMVKRVTGQ